MSCNTCYPHPPLDGDGTFTELWDNIKDEWYKLTGASEVMCQPQDNRPAEDPADGGGYTDEQWDALTREILAAAPSPIYSPAYNVLAISRLDSDLTHPLSFLPLETRESESGWGARFHGATQEDTTGVGAEFTYYLERPQYGHTRPSYLWSFTLGLATWKGAGGRIGPFEAPGTYTHMLSRGPDTVTEGRDGPEITIGEMRSILTGEAQAGGAWFTIDIDF